MAFQQAELDMISRAALDYFIDRGTVYSQTLQDKPLLAAMDKKAKTFPGGKGNISAAVKGVYTTTAAGYTHDGTVSYATPANIQRVNYAWKEHHAGITLTHTELKHDGISVVDSSESASTSSHTNREATMLANLLEDKLEDMMEGYSRSMNSFLLDDGSNDANALTGIQAIIKDTPGGSTTTGGLSNSTNTWWRNRASLDIAVTSGGTELIELMHTELRQLRRYGGKPDLAICGSAFLDRLANELVKNGNFSQNGYNSRGSTDISIADIHYGGLNFVYDPSMDDLSISGKEPNKRCYIIDTNKICMYYMEGEKMKRHNPARPAEKYVMYRAITSTCQLVATQLNSSGVYEIA
tara:strand:+ start:2331 stop:3386 length:1056 start_codon:yes stop_codon:yes gene_type:complete